jgi:hypothetical protein
MASETVTPNVGLQIPGYGQFNWQVPIQYDLGLLDLIFGGSFTIPGLSVTNLTVGNFTVSNFVALLANAYIAEAPAGTAPTSAYITSHVPLIVLGVYKNGVFQTPGPAADYQLVVNSINFNTPTVVGDQIYVTYFHG